MLRVQKGDEIAFEQLMNRHTNAVHSYIFRMCQNAQIAEELVQETFLRVWAKSKLWIPNKAKFSTWMYQIVRNLCIDHYKKQRAQFVDDVDFERIADDSLRRDEILILTLQKAIQTLPERQKTAFVLCQVEGWSQAEVAELLDSSVDAVESLLSRARRKLREILGSTQQHQ